jgi:hypothetical protein
MTSDLTWHLLLAAFLTHEIDAALRHEWRILPIFRALPEHLGERAFIWVHLPLVAVLLALGDGPWQEPFRIALAAFAVVHVGLHWMFLHHPANEFGNTSSWAIILLTGGCGIAHLLSVLA